MDESGLLAGLCLRLTPWLQTKMDLTVLFWSYHLLGGLDSCVAVDVE